MAQWKGANSMPPIVVRNDEFITMYYYPGSKILYHQIHKFFFGETFRDIWNTQIDAFQKYKVRKVLADDSAVKAWAKEDQDWAAVNWFPRAVQAGWKYWAIVLPPNITGSASIKKLAETYSAQGVETKVFPSVEDGKKWLDSCV
jgi:hypothetical protein